MGQRGQSVRQPVFAETVEINPTSIRRNPNKPGAVTLIAASSGDAIELMLRHVPWHQIERAAKAGFMVDAAFECEVIILDDRADGAGQELQQHAKIHPDKVCWSDTKANPKAALIAAFKAKVLGHAIALFGLGDALGPGWISARRPPIATPT